MSIKKTWDNLVEVVTDYGESLFFYVVEGTQEQVGVGIDYVVNGSHEIGKAIVNLLNRDYAKAHEQRPVKYHEFGHGIRPKDSEGMRRYGDSVGDYGFSSLEKLAA